MVLLLAEISRKQAYIFSSIYPKDIVGASIIIRKLTQGDSGDDTKFMGQGDAGMADLVYSGGGGFLLKFGSIDDAKAWNMKHSRAILENFPGIEYVSVVEDDCSGGVRERIQRLREKMAEKKNGRTFGFRLSGLGVEEPCLVTGAPAAKEGYLGAESQVSRELVAKQKAYDDNVKEYYGELLPEGYRFPDKDKVGTAKNMGEFIGNADGERSLVGLVAIDGNKMGKKIRQWLDRNGGAGDDEYLMQYKEFTKDLDGVYREAMKGLVRKMASNLGHLKDKGLGIDPAKKEIPIIHIVLSGDDISFVCDGRIAISAAKAFLAELGAAAKPPSLGGMDFNACAGVAIANDGFPYWKLSELAEDLQKHAKRMVADDDKDGCLIDWALLDGNIGIDPASRFTGRPYVVKSDGGADVAANGFATFEKALAAAQCDANGVANSVKAEIYALMPKMAKSAKGQDPEEFDKAADAVKNYPGKILDPDKRKAVETLLGGDCKKGVLADALQIRDKYIEIEKEGEDA